MAVIQIPNLPAATSLDGRELIEIVQSGQSRRCSVQNIANFGVRIVPGEILGTISDLKDLLFTTTMMVYVEGYSAAGDGGGGYYESIVGAPAGTYVDNGGTIILPNGGDGSSAWIYNPNQQVTVKTFGAAGDGINDDTTKISNALNFGGTIIFPEGTYKITSQVLTTKANLTIIGNGEATIKTSVGMSSNGIVINASNFTCEGMIFNAADSPNLQANLFVSGSYYSIKSCRFIGGNYNPRLPGTYPGPYWALYIGGYSGYAMYTDGFVSDIVITGGMTGINVQGGKRLNFSRINVSLCGSWGMVIGAGLSLQDYTLTQFTAVSCGLYGFSNSALFGAAGLEPKPMTNWSISNACVSYSGWRSFFDGKYGSIGNGKYGYDITDNGLDGFYMQAQARDCCVGGVESKASYFPGYDTSLNTSALTAAGNVLYFASTTGVYIGMTVTGTNIPSDTYVQSKTSTTVTLTRDVSGAVALGATINFLVGISPSGHKNVWMDFQHVNTIATQNIHTQGVYYLLEDSVSDQFFGENQYAKVYSITKQAVAWRSSIYKTTYEIVASDGSQWVCFGTVADGLPGTTGQTAPTSGAYVKRATNAATGSGAVLSFASVATIAAGMSVFGINIPDGTTVLSVDTIGLTVTLSQDVTGTGVSNGANIIMATLKSDGNLYWLCIGTDRSSSTLNDNVAFQVNCVSYIYADVISIGNGYGVYLLSTRSAASNAIDNVTITAKITGARYGVGVDGVGTVTNFTLLSSDISAATGMYCGTAGGTNNVNIVGGKITSTTGNSFALYNGTNNITISGDAYFKASLSGALYGSAGTNTISITSATFDGGVSGGLPVEFNGGTYDVTWGNTTIINRNNANQHSGWQETGTATVTTNGGVFRRDLTTAPLTTTKGNVGEHMILSAPTTTEWGYVCTSADFITPSFTWNAKVLS